MPPRSAAMVAGDTGDGHYDDNYDDNDDDDEVYTMHCARTYRLSSEIYPQASP